MKKYAKPLVQGHTLYEYFRKHPTQFLMVEDKNGRDLYSVKYMHMGVDWTLPYMMQARGIIINSKGEIIGRPYDKFFNYLQLKNIPFIDESVKHWSEWEEGVPFIATDKLDGSLVVMFYYRKALKMITASSGSTSGEFTEIFSKILKEKLTFIQRWRLRKLSKTYTIMAEYVSPNNTIVLEYKDTDIILHGARNTFTGEFMPREELEKVAETIGMKTSKVYKELDTLEKVKNYIETATGVEGLVIQFENGKMLKFKTEEYFQRHGDMSILNASRPYSEKNIVKIIDLIITEDLDDIEAEVNKSDFNKELSLAIINVKQEYFSKVDKYEEGREVVLKHSELINNKLELLDKKELIKELGMPNFIKLNTLVQGYNSYITLVENGEVYAEKVSKGEKGLKEQKGIAISFKKEIQEGKIIPYNEINFTKLYSGYIKQELVEEFKKKTAHGRLKESE